MKSFRRTRARLQTSVVTLVVSAVVAAGVLTVVALNQAPASAVPTSGFTITSTISSSATSQSPANLYPGVQRYLWYTVSNVLTVPITVTSLSISAVTPPSGCAATNLNYAGTTFTGMLVVPASGTNAVSVPVSMANPNVSQNDANSSTENCANKTFTFTFTGAAEYTATTGTALTATPMSPAVAGQPVSLTATVSTSTAGATSPVGSVTFYSCTGPTCVTKTSVGIGTLNGSGIATASTTPANTGTYYYEAIYTPADVTNFASSTSNVVTRLVNYSNACGANGKINGGLTVAAGKYVFVNCTVNGAVTVQSGGSLLLQGASVNGGVTSTGANALMVCNTSINGGVAASGSTSFVLIGDGGDDASPGCGANTVSGGITLTSNSGGFEVSGDHISGSVSLTGNTGPGPTAEDASPEVEGNTITGGLSCTTSNVPGVTDGGKINTVTGTKSGQCAGKSF